jgi:UDP-glucuronate decarboxylase
MKILVTGGNGLVGTELIRQLLDHETTTQVVCVDNYYTSKPRNHTQFEKRNNFHFVQHDVCTPIESGEYDQIYHLACPASPVHYQKDQQYTLITNITGTLNMIKLAELTGARLLLASTSEVYGDPTVNPQPETYWGNVNTLGPRSCYDEGKRVAETICTISNADTVIARIFNTYGPYMALDDGRAISNFILQALTDQPITMHGDGLQTRSFCYVQDTARGLIQLMNSHSAGPVNIGNPDEVTLLELAKQIVELCNSNSKIVHQDAAVDDPRIRCPDIGLAQQLGWSPTVERTQGLKYTIQYIKEML